MSALGPLSPPAGRLDVSPLTQPVDDAALRAFVAESKATGRPWRQMTTGLPQPGVGDVITALLPVIVPLAGLGVLFWMGGWSLAQAMWSFTVEAPFPTNLIFVGFGMLLLVAVAVAAIRVITVIRALIVPRWWWEAAYKLTRFAAANRLSYGHDEAALYPGIIFGTGTDRTVERRLTTTAGRRVEIGNYRYTVPGRERQHAKVYGWGYVAITLDRRLPHLLLDAKVNNVSAFGLSASNLPVGLAADQRLSLGGEFDAHFTLYAPADYGRDAYLIFAPDLMALFLDRLGHFDVEIIDDTMFVYGSRFDLLDPRTYAWLSELVDTVVARTIRRTERYRDDFALLESTPAPTTQSSDPVFALGGDGPPRTATNAVSERGRRLRRRTWSFASVVGLLLIGFYVYNEFIGPLFGWPTLQR